ncbi:MAG TPA: YdaS family helix-turn-helix protein [Rhodocyclaceae bacterium]|jgi:DNA-binding transcriptional regulator YdaS (Cro superfamily)|nr:YdaS family helix-turn-helix protein [Rhodocyclaceae bacterium]
MSKETLSKTVELAGGQKALADLVRPYVPSGKKISQVHIWNWLNDTRAPVPPAEYVLPIAQALNWQLTPHELREDLYPHPNDGLPLDKRAVSEVLPSCADVA